jgi:hypothetical protein
MSSLLHFHAIYGHEKLNRIFALFYMGVGFENEVLKSVFVLLEMKSQGDEENYAASALIICRHTLPSLPSVTATKTRTCSTHGRNVNEYKSFVREPQ